MSGRALRFLQPCQLLHTCTAHREQVLFVIPPPSPTLYATHPMCPNTGRPTWARQPKGTGTVIVDGVRGQQLTLFYYKLL